MTEHLLTSFLVAGGLGAVIGLERQLSARGREAYAGARTFALYGIWGAGVGLLAERFGSAGLVMGLVAVLLMLGLSYVMAGRASGDWGNTTELAALVVVLAGVLVYSDEVVAATGLIVVIAVLLRAKRPLRGLAELFSDEDVRAVLQFAVVSAIVLPLAPDRGYGPLQALNPHEIWRMVVLVSAIGLVGYVALRMFGSRGLAATGLLGGLVSSTAVTLGYARMSRRRHELAAPLIAGVLGASALMYLRVLAEAAIVGPQLAERLTWPMVAAFVAVSGVTLLWWLRSVPAAKDGPSPLEFGNPVTLTTALQFGALYGVIVFLARFLIDRAASGSLVVLGAVSGITDVDAITLSAANLVSDGLDPHEGSRVVLAAVAVNTFVKAGLAVGLGGRTLRKVALMTLGVTGIALGLVTVVSP